MKFFKSIEDYTKLNESAQEALKYMNSKGYVSQDEMNQLETLKKLLVKHPNWLLPFVKFRFDEGIAFHRIDSILKDLEEKRNLLHLLPKPVIEYTEFEKLLDGIIQIERYQKAKKIIDKIPNSAIRKELLLKDNIEKVKNIADAVSNLPDDFLQNNFYKKASALKNSTDAIKALLAIMKKETIPNVKKKALANGSKIFYESLENQCIVVEVFTYKSCKKMGPTAWCIVREEDSFDEYINQGFNRQYIIYDTNRPVVDTMSIIGITVTPNGTVKSAHQRNDDPITILELEDSFKFLPWKELLRPLTNSETDTILINLIEAKKLTIDKQLQFILDKGSEQFIKDKMGMYMPDKFWLILNELVRQETLKHIGQEGDVIYPDKNLVDLIEYVFKIYKPVNLDVFYSFIADVIIYKYEHERIKDLLKKVELNKLINTSNVDTLAKDIKTLLFHRYDETLLEDGDFILNYLYECGITSRIFWGSLKNNVVPFNFSKGNFGTEIRDVLRKQVINFCNARI